jgi:6-phosphogluconolactonase
VIHVLPDPESVAEHAADRIAHVLPTVPNLVLAGGSTPAATYRALCTRDVDWERLDLWLGDERWVPHDHTDSNLRMARGALAPAAHRVLPTPWASDLSPEQAAAIYQDLLASRSPDGDVAPGLVLLGIGDDAHTASLFPGSDALERDDADFVATFVHQKATWRLTLTERALAKADEILFLVCGPGKADALAAIHEGDGSVPAARVSEAASNVLWIVDEAAGAGLTRTEVTRP